MALKELTKITKRLQLLRENNRLSKPKLNFKDFWLKEKMEKEKLLLSPASLITDFICVFFYSRFQRVGQK